MSIGAWQNDNNVFIWSINTVDLGSLLAVMNFYEYVIHNRILGKIK